MYNERLRNKVNLKRECNAYNLDNVADDRKPMSGPQTIYVDGRINTTAAQIGAVTNSLDTRLDNLERLGILEGTNTTFESWNLPNVLQRPNYSAPTGVDIYMPSFGPAEAKTMVFVQRAGAIVTFRKNTSFWQGATDAFYSGNGSASATVVIPNVQQVYQFVWTGSAWCVTDIADDSLANYYTKTDVNQLDNGTVRLATNGNFSLANTTVLPPTILLIGNTTAIDITFDLNPIDGLHTVIHNASSMQSNMVTSSTALGRFRNIQNTNAGPISIAQGIGPGNSIELVSGSQFWWWRQIAAVV